MLNCFPKTVKARIVANAIRKSATEVMVLPLTIFLSGQYGVQYAGLAIMIMLLLGSIGTLVGGKLANKYAIKKIIAPCEIGHIFSLLGMFLYIQHAHSFFIFFYLIKTIFFSLSLPAGETIFFTDLTPSERKKAYITDTLLSSFFMSIFSMIGFFFLKKEIKVVIIISTILSLLYFILNVLFCPSSHKKSSTHRDLTYREHFKDGQFLMISASSVIFFAVSLLFNNYLAVKIAGSQGSLFSLVLDGPIFFSLLRILSIIVPLSVLILTKKPLFLIKDEALYKCQIIWSVTVFFLYNLHVYWLIIVVVCLSNFLESILLPCRQSIIVNSISESHGGTYMAVIALYKRIGNILSVLLFSFSSVCPPMMWNMVILSLLVGGTWLLYAATKRPQIRHSDIQYR